MASKMSNLSDQRAFEEKGRRSAQSRQLGSSNLPPKTYKKMFPIDSYGVVGQAANA
jgi:hypothetical protein